MEKLTTLPKETLEKVEKVKGEMEISVRKIAESLKQLLDLLEEIKSGSENGKVQAQKAELYIREYLEKIMHNEELSLEEYMYQITEKIDAIIS